MKWWVAVLLLILIGVGFYYRVMTFDPLTFILMAVVLWNNYTIMKRQQESIDVVAKSHSVLALNQKEILRRLDVVRADVKKKQ